MKIYLIISCDAHQTYESMQIVSLQFNQERAKKYFKQALKTNKKCDEDGWLVLLAELEEYNSPGLDTDWYRNMNEIDNSENYEED